MLAQVVALFHPLATALVTSVPPITNVQGAVERVDHYLQVGGDASTEVVLRQDTLKAYVYFLHEHLELSALFPYLDREPPPGPVKKVGAGSTDRWATNLTNLRRHHAVDVADRNARVVEAQTEQAFARLLLKETVSLSGLIGSIQLASDPSAVEKTRLEASELVVRQTVLGLAGLHDEARESEKESAAAARSRLHRLTPEVVEGFGGPKRLAAALLRAAGFPILGAKALAGDAARSWSGVKMWRASQPA